LHLLTNVSLFFPAGRAIPGGFDDDLIKSKQAFQNRSNADRASISRHEVEVRDSNAFHPYLVSRLSAKGLPLFSIRNPQAASRKPQAAARRFGRDRLIGRDRTTFDRRAPPISTNLIGRPSPAFQPRNRTIPLSRADRSENNPWRSPADSSAGAENDGESVRADRSTRSYRRVHAIVIKSKL
jgi:hypothetical protein